MNSQILNRDFSHPADGWYQIEARGEHPNRAAGVIQVIDGEATQSIVNRFNADAAAGTLRHGNEMLIDHEHFSDQPDQETRAYGWLQQLQNRDDGIYGRIRWTRTGQDAVDGGDYRFFSTEYEPDDLKLVNDGKTKRVKPLRLAGLTLTNMNNNRGQKPITNRILNGDVAGHEFHGNQYADVESAIKADSGYRKSKNLGAGIREHAVEVNASTPRARAEQILRSSKASGAEARSRISESDSQHAHIIIHSNGIVHHVNVVKIKNRNFAESSDLAASNQNPNERTNTMQLIAQKLGLAAEASEDAILTEVTKIKNRLTTLEPLEEENKTLKAGNLALLDEQVDALMDAHGIKADDKVRNRLKPTLIGYKNREERVAALLDFGFKPVEAKTEIVAQQQRQLRNKDTKQPDKGGAASGLDEKELAQKAEAEVQDYKIRNRCTYGEARNAVRTAKPELFGLK